MLTSEEGTAVLGEDYGGVGAKLTFPMGVMQRSVELPVGHGAAEKDFYVSIAPLGGEKIGLSRTRVVIPSAEAPEKDAALMESSRYDEALNLQKLEVSTQRGQWWEGNKTGFVNPGEYYNGGLSYSGRSYEDVSSSDKNETSHGCGYIRFRLPYEKDNYTYAYDGVHVSYRFFTNWANGLFKVAEFKYYPSGYLFEKNLYTRDFGDCGYAGDNTADVYYNAVKQPDGLQISCQNLENQYSLFRDCHVKEWVDSVEPIKRSFSVMIDPADPLPFAGLSEDEKRSWVKVMSDGTNKSILNLYAFDTFSISKPIGQNYTRLKDVVAVSAGGEELSISNFIAENVDKGVAYVAGLSDSFDVTLSHELLRFLGDRDCILWNKSGSSYSGVIHLKPVFDYAMDVTVDVQESEFGGLYLEEGDDRLTPGTHTFHLGDKLVFRQPAGKVNGMRGCGVGHAARSAGSAMRSPRPGTTTVCTGPWRRA